MWFASGSNSVAPIRALQELGKPYGVAVTALTQEGIRQIMQGKDTPVFVDSGAFSEVDRDLNVVNPINHEEWKRRLSIYEGFAGALHGDVYLVAPDRVGDPDHSLTLLRHYKPELDRIRALGAQIIVPLQAGMTGSLADHHAKVAQILGKDELYRFIRLGRFVCLPCGHSPGLFTFSYDKPKATGNGGLYWETHTLIPSKTLNP